MARSNYTEAQRRRDVAAQNKSYRSGIRAKPTRFDGVDYDSRTEARWAQFLNALDIDFLAGPVIDELAVGVGKWKPDLALRRGGGGFVWVEVKPFKPDESMFVKVRQKLEAAENHKISVDNDALLFIDALPNLTGFPCRFGWGAIYYDWSGAGEREWSWEDAWLWRQPSSGRFGLRLESGFDLLLNDDPSATPGFPVPGDGFHLRDWDAEDDRPTR